MKFIQPEATSFVKRIDEVSASITYVWQAKKGTATSSASWFVQKIETTWTETTILTASNGLTPSDNQIWDDRASLSYS